MFHSLPNFNELFDAASSIGFFPGPNYGSVYFLGFGISQDELALAAQKFVSPEVLSGEMQFITKANINNYKNAGLPVLSTFKIAFPMIGDLMVVLSYHPDFEPSQEFWVKLVHELAVNNWDNMMAPQTSED